MEFLEQRKPIPLHLGQGSVRWCRRLLFQQGVQALALRLRQVRADKLDEAALVEIDFISDQICQCCVTRQRHAVLLKELKSGQRKS